MTFSEYKSISDQTISVLENQSIVDTEKLVHFARALNGISKDIVKNSNGICHLKDYLKAINELCVYSHKCENPEAHKKVMRMVVECSHVIDQLVLNPVNSYDQEVINKKAKVEIFKAKKMFQREFYSLKHKKVS